MSVNAPPGIDHNLYALLARSIGYQARAEIAALIAEARHDPQRLEPYGFKVYSQGDEDGILEEIFRRLRIEKGTFCEIGVENGLECNSLYLVHKGWRGAWVEGNPHQHPFIQEKFASIIPSRLRPILALVTMENVNAILASVIEAFGDLDLLSIDIDGNDGHLFECLACRPKVIAIEYNSKFPPAVSKRQVYDPHLSWRGTDYFGASLRSLNETATAHGYRLVGTNLVGTNAFFVRSDLAGDQFTADASPEYLYNPPRYWLAWDHYNQIGHRADFGAYEDLAEPAQP
jgi:hypothetical protein